MIITEFKTDDHSYLIIDHEPILPSFDYAVLTDIPDRGDTVGVLNLTYYNDFISYDVSGRLTSAGRVTVSDRAMRIEYTDGYGFDVSGLDYSNPYIDTFITFLFNDCNKKTYYASLFQEPSNCVILTKRFNIYSWINDHSYNGISNGIQVYRDGCLVYTKDSMSYGLGLLLDSKQYNVDSEYMEILERLINASHCELIMKDDGQHIVEFNEQDVMRIRSFYNAPNFRTSGYIYRLKPIELDGRLYSMTSDPSGRYHLVRSTGLTIRNSPDWLDDFDEFGLEEVSTVVDMIREDYDPADIIEHYANKTIEVNFTDTISRIYGDMFDMSYIKDRYLDQAYYNRDRDTLVINAQPCGELTAISNLLKGVHEISGLSDDTDYRKRFEEHTEFIWYKFDVHHYMPYAGTAHNPLLATIVSATDDYVVMDLILRPALLSSVYRTDAQQRQTALMAMDYILSNMPYVTRIGQLLSKSIDPICGSALNDFFAKKYKNPFTIVHDLEEALRPLYPYGFGVMDLGFDKGNMSQISSIDGLINSFKGYIPVNAAGRNSWYKLGQIYVQRIKVDLANGPFVVQEPSMDYNVISNMLSEEKRVLFTRLFTNNTLCMGAGTSLIPFHLFFNINPDSVPEEIYEAGLFSATDLECHCLVEKGDYLQSTCKGGVYYACPV